MKRSGTVTNTFGDVQLVRKAADRAGVKPEFEILVRLAGAMGVDVKTLVPFGKGGVTADLGQSRGAQAGEADRHAVWLAANGLEPKLSPFDPLAVLDEIARLVPGYALDRLNLFERQRCADRAGLCAGCGIDRTGLDYARSRWIVYLRNAGGAQRGAQGTGAASGGDSWCRYECKAEAKRG